MKIRGVPWPSAVGLLLLPRFRFDRPLHVFLCICDHYEPLWQKPARHVQDARVERWVRDYPRAVAGLGDSAGRPPQRRYSRAFYAGPFRNRSSYRMANWFMAARQ